MLGKLADTATAEGKLTTQNYMAAISQLHQSEMKDLLMGFIGSLNTSGDSNEACMLCSGIVGSTLTNQHSLQLLKQMYPKHLLYKSQKQQSDSEGATPQERRRNRTRMGFASLR